MEIQQLHETTSKSSETFSGDVVTSTPLDLSVKQVPASSTSQAAISELAPSPTAEVPQSLNELANLQKRFIDSTIPQNFVDQLQKVTNGPTGLPVRSGSGDGMLPTVSASSNSSGSLGVPSSLAPPNWPNDWNSICKNLPLNYQLAAYSLWSSNFAAALSAGQSVNPMSAADPSNLFPTNSLFPFPLHGTNPFPTGAGSVSPMLNRDSTGKESSISTSNGLFKRNSLLSKGTKYSGTRLPAATPPEALGISMRGNQKYSAYYQRPFHAPSNNNSGKRLENPTAKKSPSNSSNNLISSNIDSVLSKEKEKSTTRARETAFVCSCGEEFENLYIFTLHMKDSDHLPRSSQTYQDIPKLVRGQDMWINSETEQTREILRCMHCRQSFQTLPDLTMHMIKTNHYSEIVYSDSGRCVFVNPDNNISLKSLKDKEKLTTTATLDPSSGEKHKASTSSPKPIEKNQISSDIISSPISKKSNSESCQPPKKRAKLLNASSLEYEANVRSSTQTPEPIPSVITKTEITEADSATVDSEADCDSAASPSNTQQIITDKMDTGEEAFQSVSTDSVIRQIESFMEKSLPKPSSKIHNVNKGSREFDYQKHSPTYRSSVKQKPIKKGSGYSTSIPYVAPPDTGEKPSENPLSSLQKLVETTHKNESRITSSPLSVKTLSSNFMTSSNDISKSNKVSNSCSTSSSSSHFMPPSPTVIMVNPTYIYQPAFAPLSHLYPPPYPWYPGLSAFGTNKIEEVTDSAPVEKSPPTTEELEVINSSKSNAVDLSKINNSLGSQDNIAAVEDPELNETASFTNSTPEETASAYPNRRSINTELLASTSLSGNNGASSGSGTIVKKAKCNYCGKPFANKGQVRLHISKGKCPSLLQSCHSTSMSSLASMSGAGPPPHFPGLLSPAPFPYLPLDYVQRLTSLGAASDATNSAAINEQLQIYYALTKQLSSK